MTKERKTKEDVLNISEKEKVLFVRLQFVDILGMPKNIVIPPSRLEEALEKGIPFDGSSIAGYATIEESDKVAKPDPKSFVILPEEIEKLQNLTVTSMNLTANVLPETQNMF